MQSYGGLLEPKGWKLASGVMPMGPGGPGPPQIFSKDEKLFLHKNILHT